MPQRVEEVGSEIDGLVSKTPPHPDEAVGGRVLVVLVVMVLVAVLASLSVCLSVSLSLCMHRRSGLRGDNKESKRPSGRQ